ncbi:MAG: hypothetical protein IPL59_17200 [Candidatus Competibacteraceae bacterium]|nr:hypothetical protein [Candidatus Competibacteraceae bacterium]
MAIGNAAWRMPTLEIGRRSLTRSRSDVLDDFGDALQAEQKKRGRNSKLERPPP